MPYRRAHIYLAIFLVVTIFAFWNSYFAKLSSAPGGHHLHGITATLWMCLLIWQSWTIHKPKPELHALTGKMSFIIAPLFIAGGIWVTQITILKESPFKEMFGLRLSPADLIVALLFPWLYAQALRHRRNVQLHARYMLVTIVPLIGPSLVRFLVNFVPGFTIDTLDQLPRFGVALNFISVLSIIGLSVLMWRDKHNGISITPLLVGGLFYILFMLAAVHGFGKTQAWESFAYAFAGVPTSVLLVSGIAIGAAAGWWGWKAGKQSIGVND